MYEVDGVFSVRIRPACGQLVFRRLQRRDQTNQKGKFWLFVEIADPTMGLQFFNLFSRQSTPVAELRRNVLNTLIDLLLPVTSEVIVAEIAFFERSVRCDFPSQSTFVQGYPY